MTKYQNPQEWLNKKYSNRQITTKVEISWREEPIQGQLTISDFPKLEKITIWNQKNLNLQINNCPKLTELSCGYNSLPSLTITSCPKLKKIGINYSQLTTLNINHLKDLEVLDVNNNNLTELNVLSFVNLKEFRCLNNQLTSLDLNNNLELEILNIEDNNFFEQDLSFLSHLVNLRYLWLGNVHDQEKLFQQGIYNRFFGSLEFLKNLKKLEWLDIAGTNVDSGLEYLPKSVKEFNCSAWRRKDAKVKTIYNLFVNKQGIVEADGYGCIKNFSQKLQEYKQKFEENARNFLKDEFQIRDRQIQELKEKLKLVEKIMENQTPHQVLKKTLTKLQENIQETEEKLGINEQTPQIIHNPPK